MPDVLCVVDTPRSTASTAPYYKPAARRVSHRRTAGKRRGWCVDSGLRRKVAIEWQPIALRTSYLLNPNQPFISVSRVFVLVGTQVSKI